MSKLTDTGRFHSIVDVLRALSVLAVVAYHAGVPGIPGGFVGVDVFFVISGFLIIGQIVAEHQKGGFSYAGFWARRALRILPTYLLVIVVSSVIALYVLVMPEEFREFGRQVRWSAAMVVNHLFLAEQGYFDTAAETKPLLHLWSLAVEEQFYLFAPLVLGLLCGFAAPRFGRTGRWAAGAIVVLMFVVSLWLCVKFTGTGDDDRNYAFYLMPLRAWEFILGGAIPFLLPWMTRWPRWALSSLMAGGFALVLGAIFGFGHDTAFPSWNALIPAVGAMLVIAAGLAAPGMPLANALAIRPVLWIGLVSYAWYLWHWPLMAFTRIYNFGELTLPAGLAMAGLSLLLAALTYVYLEKPIKEWRIRRKPTLGLKPVAVGVLACVVVAMAGGVLETRHATRLAAELPEALLPQKVKSAGPCRLTAMKSFDRCAERLEKEGREVLGVVIGDSHARAAYSALNKAAARRDSSLVSVDRSGCVPIVGVRLVRTSTGKVYPCHKDKERGMRYLFKKKVRPEYAIVYARWSNATPWLEEDGSEGEQLRYIVDVDTGESEPKRRVFVESLQATLGKLRKSGVKRILVVAPTPEFGRDLSSCLIRADRYGVDRDQYCSVSKASVLGRRYYSYQWLSEAVQGVRGTRLINPGPVFCDASSCRGYDSTGLLYRDDDHLNEDGMKKVIERYSEDFDWVMGV